MQYLMRGKERRGGRGKWRGATISCANVEIICEVEKNKTHLNERSKLSSMRTSNVHRMQLGQLEPQKVRRHRLPFQCERGVNVKWSGIDYLPMWEWGRKIWQNSLTINGMQTKKTSVNNLCKFCRHGCSHCRPHSFCGDTLRQYQFPNSFSAY